MPQGQTKKKQFSRDGVSPVDPHTAKYSREPPYSDELALSVSLSCPVRSNQPKIPKIGWAYVGSTVCSALFPKQQSNSARDRNRSAKLIGHAHRPRFLTSTPPRPHIVVERFGMDLRSVRLEVMPEELLPVHRRWRHCDDQSINLFQIQDCGETLSGCKRAGLASRR